MSAAAAATAAVIEGIVVWRREDDDAAWSQVAPSLPLAVTCLLVLEGDDSDFYHREMNSDCSPAFRALGDGECQYKHNGIFRAATPPLIHSTRLYC